MASIEMRYGGGVKYRDPLGRQKSKSFVTKDDARRFSRVVDQLVRTADGTFHRTQPKTSASVRSITISRMTAEILASHCQRFAVPGRDGPVFPNTAGNPPGESSFYVHHFKKAQVSCGIALRFRDLRHTSVALAIAGGAHPKAI